MSSGPAVLVITSSLLTFNVAQPLVGQAGDTGGTAPASDHEVHDSKNPDTTEKPDTNAARIRFRTVGNSLIAVRGAIGRLERLTLLIDTGTYRTVIDRRIARKLELRGTSARMFVLDREVEAQRVTVPTVQVGTIHRAARSVLSADLGALAAGIGVRPDAIIGFDVLGGSCFIVDYDARVLAFRCTDTWAHTVRFDLRSPYVALRATIDGQPYRLLMDTGSDAIVLFREALAKHRSLSLELPVVATHAGGSVRLRRFTARNVTVGGHDLGDRPAFILDGSREELGFDGVLGARWIAPRLQIDLERMVLAWDDAPDGGMPRLRSAGWR